MSKGIGYNLMLAGLLIAVSACLAYLKHRGVMGGELVTRAVMVAIGVVTAFNANAIPKAVKFRTARGQSVERTAGLAFVLSGIGYAAAWAFAPIAIAADLSVAAVAVAIAWVIVYCVWTRSRPA